MSMTITAAIPHRPPMLLVDEIVSRDENQIVCRKTIRSDEYFLQGHYPDLPLVPGVILCEIAMQSGAVLLAHWIEDGDARVPVATRMNQVKFKRMVRPGDVVEAHVELTERMGEAFFLTAKVLSQGKLAARLDFACTLAEPDGAP